MYTTVCFDLDGTLLNSQKQIEEGSKDAIKYLKQSGVHIVFASARHFSEIVPYVKECGLSDSDYIISCDGQYILDVEGTLIWESKFLKRKDLLWIYRHLKSEFTMCTNCGDFRFKNETLKKCIKRHKFMSFFVYKNSKQFGVIFLNGTIIKAISNFCFYTFLIFFTYY